MVKLVDAVDSKSTICKNMAVRVRPGAPILIALCIILFSSCDNVERQYPEDQIVHRLKKQYGYNSFDVDIIKDDQKTSSPMSCDNSDLFQAAMRYLSMHYTIKFADKDSQVISTDWFTIKKKRFVGDGKISKRRINVLIDKNVCSNNRHDLIKVIIFKSASKITNDASLAEKVKNEIIKMSY